jgi:hypothetical protein
MLAQQKINTFSFIPLETSEQAIALLLSENLKKNVSTLSGVPLSLLAVYRVIIENFLT